MEISQTVRSLEDKTSQLKRNIRHSQEAVQEIKGYKKTAGVQGKVLIFEYLFRNGFETDKYSLD